MSLLFRIHRGRTPKGRSWLSLEITWGHTFHKLKFATDMYRYNWHGEIAIGLHTWWVRPGYSNHFYDGPHPAISLGFIVITWEPWGGGEYIEWWKSAVREGEGQEGGAGAERGSGA